MNQKNKKINMYQSVIHDLTYHKHMTNKCNWERKKKIYMYQFLHLSLCKHMTKKNKKQKNKQCRSRPLASSEASRSGSTLFTKGRAYLGPASIGLKIGLGTAFEKRTKVYCRLCMHLPQYVPRYMASIMIQVFFQIVVDCYKVLHADTCPI